MSPYFLRVFPILQPYNYQVSHQLNKILAILTSNQFGGRGYSPDFNLTKIYNGFFKKISYTKFSRHKSHIKTLSHKDQKLKNTTVT